VIEDAVDHLGLCNEGDDAPGLAAAGTFQRLDLEDAAQQLGPTSFPERR